MDKPYHVIGLGNTIMDFLVDVENHHLTTFNIQKGKTHFVDERKAKEILELLSHHNLPIDVVPGGSAANTLRGLALLGANVLFCGKVGNDTYGNLYIESLSDHGLTVKASRHTNAITGHAITFITPDAERTFSVHLGANVHFGKEDIPEEDIAKSKVLHLEGYQLEGETKESIMHALELAKRYGTKISLDLSDPGVIQRNKFLLWDIIKQYKPILFVNEIEAKELTGLNEQEAAREIAKYTDIAIIKMGAQGSWIAHHGTITKIDALPAQAIDTTGAGDTYAAGFLYGYTHNWPVEKAGKLGSSLAAKVVEQKGVKLKHLNFVEIKKKIEKG